MLKKIVSTMVAMAIVLAMVGLTGCEKDEIKVHREVEVKDQVIQQNTVVTP